MQKKRLDKKQIKKTVLQVAVFALILFAVLGLFALKAYATSVYDCGHDNYNSNGVCLTCRNCEHWYFTGDSCDNCSFICPHPEWIDSECVVCHSECIRHRFTNGICDICGYGCGHSKGSTYTYEPLSTSPIYHTIRAWCVTCGARNTSDPLNGAQVRCTYSQGSDYCNDCLRDCVHLKVSTTFEQREGDKFDEDYKYHDVVKTCVYCNTVVSSSQESHTYDNSNTCISCHLSCAHPTVYDSDDECQYCGMNCAHVYDSNGKCTNCAYQCAHLHTNIIYFPSQDGENHFAVTMCSVCNVQISSNTSAHRLKTVSAQNGSYQYHTNTTRCDFCAFVEVDTQALHTFGDNSACIVCKYVCSSHAFNNGICTICHFKCTTHDFEKGECRVCDFVCSSHSWDSNTGECTVCDIYCVHKYSNVNYWADNGVCSRCSYACSHPSYSKGDCVECAFQCPHLDISGKLNELDDEHFVHYCKTCDMTFGNILMPLAHAQYFRFAPSPCTWNVVKSYHSEFTDNVGYRHFERYSIDRFEDALDFNGSAHIIGGDKITDSVSLPSAITASRYLVVRLRLSGISHIELYAYGGNKSVCYEDIVNECSSVQIYNVEELPHEEWCDLVIDMSMFDGAEHGTYSVGSTISHALFTLCFKYTSVNSYADIEFFALCDDLNKVDTVINFFDFDPLVHNIYLATDEQTISPTLAHDFSKSDTCPNCGYECEHVDTYSVDISTNTDCGSETRCMLCEALLRSTVRSHFFNTDNSDTCSNCSFVCTHRYSGGVCMYCEWECIHNHSDGSIRCSNCGYYLDYEGYNDPAGFQALFAAIYDAQANTFFKMLGYEILGVNVAGLIVSVIALAIVIWLLKKVL